MENKMKMLSCFEKKFVSENIIPSAERQILSALGQIRQRKGKSCQLHDNSVSGKVNPVRITTILSAER
jgi:hypothetical protein